MRQTDWAVEVQLAFDRHILNGMQLRSKSPVFEGWGTRLDVEREVFQLKILRKHLQPCPCCLPCDSAGHCSAGWCVYAVEVTSVVNDGGLVASARFDGVQSAMVLCQWGGIEGHLVRPADAWDPRRDEGFGVLLEALGIGCITEPREAECPLHVELLLNYVDSQHPEHLCRPRRTRIAPRISMRQHRPCQRSIPVQRPTRAPRSL